jgi:catechol 2,3-dioxygenase-like lactoylglutathione lyase family enzyme
VFDRVTLHASDPEASRRFYEAVLPTLAVSDWGELAIEGNTPTTRGLHIGFAAPSRDAVDAFWRAGTGAGYQDDGPPGPRPQYSEDYYGAFLLDPDGNSAEAVHHGETANRGLVDHLWMRVADVAASRPVYDELARELGLDVRVDTPELVRYGAPDGSFTILRGTPTEGLHLTVRGVETADHRRVG